ncbi:MAG: anthranilate synthase component I family protein [Bacteroidota bacterium]
MRVTRSFHIESIPRFKDAILLWAQQFEQVAWLDSNFHNDRHGVFEGILAVDSQTSLSVKTCKNIDEAKDFYDETQDWLFGYFSYDFKNALEKLESTNHDGLGFPELYFFQPRKVIGFKAHMVTFMYMDSVADAIESDFETIVGYDVRITDHRQQIDHVKIKLRIHKDEYFDRIAQLQHYIQRGNIYEANFCQECYAVDTSIDPLSTYLRLNSISEPPFAVFFRFDDKFLLSASPERYLQKKGDTIVSQPIKGTAPRSDDPHQDNVFKMQLQIDGKERAENIMIADLVRNDLSRSALKGSVIVEELCKVYSFKQVHQMISTITAKVDPDQHPMDIIAETFPMGSMTGAPKIAAMKIIEELEVTKRGLYSGAVGYFDPKGNFDFNVVIRSILYNATKKYISYSVGSAITAKSIPESEYEECLLKAKAMRSVLEEG